MRKHQHHVPQSRLSNELHWNRLSLSTFTSKLLFRPRHSFDSHPDSAYRNAVCSAKLRKKPTRSQLQSHWAQCSRFECATSIGCIICSLSVLLLCHHTHIHRAKRVEGDFESAWLLPPSSSQAAHYDFHFALPRHHSVAPFPRFHLIIFPFSIVWFTTATHSFTFFSLSLLCCCCQRGCCFSLLKNISYSFIHLAFVWIYIWKVIANGYARKWHFWGLNRSWRARFFSLSLALFIPRSAIIGKCLHLLAGGAEHFHAEWKTKG